MTRTVKRMLKKRIERIERNGSGRGNFASWRVHSNYIDRRSQPTIISITPNNPTTIRLTLLDETSC